MLAQLEFSHCPGLCSYGVVNNIGGIGVDTTRVVPLFRNHIIWTLVRDQLCCLLERNGRKIQCFCFCAVAALTWAVW